ncbi:DUF6527 family protein [Lacibacterium aquatile]|uniref:DUF6527 family protein n=1 Tax=Lacibacterium aquatile TaxID=1168082 RepID=A0ABW5DY82_9PROT
MGRQRFRHHAQSDRRPGRRRTSAGDAEVRPAEEETPMIPATLKAWWEDLRRWYRTVREQRGPARKLEIIEGDMMPTTMPARNLVLAREDGEDWSVGMLCPCGCGDVIELMLIKNTRPRWDLTIEDGRPSLHPSVWRATGCRAHFWLKNGRVRWCS